MAEKNFLNQLSGATAGKKQSQNSPWNTFLGTLDNYQLSDKDAMTLFARTLAVAKSDWKDSHGNTLLMHMAGRGRTAIVRRLIKELYANIYAVNEEGMSALHMAARAGYKDTCEELIKAGANPWVKNQNGDTPAMLAKYNKHDEISDFLRIQQIEQAHRAQQQSYSK